MTKQAKYYFVTFLAFAAFTYGAAFVLYKGLVASVLAGNVLFIAASISWIAALVAAGMFLHEAMWRGGE